MFKEFLDRRRAARIARLTAAKDQAIGSINGLKVHALLEKATAAQTAPVHNLEGRSATDDSRYKIETESELREVAIISRMDQT